MTTFTTEDRIIAEKDGSYTVNVEGGTVTTGVKDLKDKEIMSMLKLGLDQFRANLKKAKK